MDYRSVTAAMSAQQPSQISTMHAEQSAGEFLTRAGSEIQNWLHSSKTNGALEGKRWVLTAALSNGLTIVVRVLSAHGFSTVKLEGELSDGTPVLLVAHHHSVQLLATLVPLKTEEPPKREIGFHTGIETVKIDQ